MSKTGPCGTPKSSTAQLSSAQLSSAQLGPAQPSPAQLSPAQLSSAQLSSAQPSSAQLSSAQLSSAQLSSAQLSSADPSHSRIGGHPGEMHVARICDPPDPENRIRQGGCDFAGYIDMMSDHMGFARRSSRNECRGTARGDASPTGEQSARAEHRNRQGG
eukprot:gene14209-biopygen594